MKYLLIVMLLFVGCSNHRVVLVYESGDAAVEGGTEITVDTNKEPK